MYPEWVETSSENSCDVVITSRSNKANNATVFQPTTDWIFGMNFGVPNVYTLFGVAQCNFKLILDQKLQAL